MAVAIRVQCDVKGCERHFDVALPQGARDLVDLSVGAGGMWVEALLDPPRDWDYTGREKSFRVRCPAHVAAGEHPADS